MFPIDQPPLSEYSRHQVIPGGHLPAVRVIPDGGEKLPEESVVISGATQESEYVHRRESLRHAARSSESLSSPSVKAYRDILDGMVKGNRAGEALTVISEDLSSNMDIDTLRALRDSGVTIVVPDVVPEDMKKNRTTGTYEAPDKKVTIPFEYLIDKRERPVLVVHEMGHAFDHLIGEMDQGIIDPKTGISLKKGYMTYHSSGDEKMRTSYEQYIRRVDSLKVAIDGIKRMRAGKGREGLSIKGLYPARYSIETLPDGRTKVDIKWSTQPQVEKGIRKLKLSGLTFLAGAAGCFLTGPGSLLFLGFAGISGLGGILGIKTLFGKDMTYLYEKHTEVFTRELPRETITLKGDRKLGFVHEKEKDSCILPEKFYPLKDFKYIQWSKYAHDARDVNEYFAESVSHGTLNLEQRDPGAYEIFKGGFHPTAIT